MRLFLATTATCVTNVSTLGHGSLYLRLFYYILNISGVIGCFVNIEGDFIHLRPLKDLWQKQ